MNITLNQDKGTFSLKTHDNSNECQHDIFYVSKVKPINKIHAASCNRNAIKLKEQSTRTMSTLVNIIGWVLSLWCLSFYKAKLVQTFFLATVNILIQCPRPTFPEIQKKKKYSNCFRVYFSCLTKVCNIQNTPSSKTILVYC